MDLLRALSTIAVILIHITGTILYNSNNKSLTYNFSLVLNQLTRFSVPAFIFLSGFGLALSYKKESKYLYYLIHRLKKIIPDYLVWCIIYIFLIENPNLTYNDKIHSIFDGTLYYHFYFVPIIIILYLIFPIFYKFFKTKFALFITFFLNMGIYILLRYPNIPKNVSEKLTRESTINWIFYFVLGVYLCTNYNRIHIFIKKHKNKLLILLLITTYILLKDTYSCLKINSNLDYGTTFIRPSVMLFSIFFILYIMSFSINNITSKKIFYIISNHSYTVYLSHPLLLYWLKKYYTQNKYIIGSYKFFIISFSICFIGGLLISILINKFKKLL
ncbi:MULTISPECIES: acyltransferase [Clostridium]|nr:MULTISPECIES: acyltransferase [Clostridium]KIS25368.1 acyltransferase [Clostridium botulinum B2 450]MDU2831603.1 acyltransferase [Clostridium botulinum]MDU4546569.1 acyltransferase [Clostridium botulinum]